MQKFCLQLVLAFYMNQYDTKMIVETLLDKNFKMIQKTSSVDGNLFSCSLNLTNMAKFTETSTIAEVAFMSVSQQACEYLRGIAQIESFEMMNISSISDTGLTITSLPEAQVATKLTVESIANGDLSSQQVENVNKFVTPQASVISSLEKKASDVRVTSPDLSMIGKWTQLMELYSSGWLFIVTTNVLILF